MNQIEQFLQFKQSNAVAIKKIVSKIGAIAEDAHWNLIDDMKGYLGSEAANGSSEDDDDQDNAISSAETWVTDHCSDGGIEEDVAMALWLRGTSDGESFLLSEMVVSLPRMQGSQTAKT